MKRFDQTLVKKVFKVLDDHETTTFASGKKGHVQKGSRVAFTDDLYALHAQLKSLKILANAENKGQSGLFEQGHKKVGGSEKDQVP